MVRTLVAVGTARLASMLAASDFDMPLSVDTTSWGSVLESSVNVDVGGWGDDAGAWAGIGCGFGWIDVVRAMGWLPVVVGGSTGAATTGAASTGAATTEAASTGAGGAIGSAGAAGSVGALGGAGAVGGVGTGGVEDASTVVWW